MKKWISLMLSVMMLFGCMDAMAATLTVREDVTSSVTGTEAKTEDTLMTKMYLQVDNSAQIIATVPLVLVFKTDMDGNANEAVTSRNYAITNNSPNADLYVIQSQVPMKTGDLTIETYDTAGLENRLNTYQAQLDFGQGTVTVPAQDGGEATSETFDLKHDLFTSTNTFEVTLSNQQKAKCYPKIAKGDGTLTITPSMKTSPLSFMTSNDEGLEVLSVQYTLAANLYVASKGSTIPSVSLVNGIPAEE